MAEIYFLFFTIASSLLCVFYTDLNDFPKSRRDPVQANARSGIGIECLPPKTGYSSTI